ncbi:hypothetical protein [Sphingomonas sp. SORGH_AS_0879]|uniref:hypothetical protein n=1 Tax=Sphingomonas sp. SORGH_AS_0879 TaxID=3041790 RepID=UPI002789377B|nr:hypothetical protein [Sphingomonas sp. SORGH_AS_0879]MDQ1229414.1 hypothetical protein [Sphingomonas sp. SORGH_AS_0879]
MVAMTMAMLVMAAPVQDGAPPAVPSVEAIMAKTREASGVQKRCVYDPNGTDITVCGRRNADRFRMPFEIPPEPGDPRHEGVMDERTRLLARSNSVKSMSPFLVGGGHVGVTLDTNPRGGGGPTLRKPAP